MNEQKNYICAVCGESYKTIEERMNCESKCLAKLKKAEEEKKRNEQKLKQQEKEQAIYKALDNVNTMIAEYLKEYDTLTLNKEYPYLSYIFKHLSWWL